MPGKSLGLSDISKLLKEDAQKAQTGRGPKIDKTEDRSLNNWMKLFHHFCLTDCEHRDQAPEGSEAVNRNNRACWNPDCMDHKREPGDRGMNCVVEVKGQWICRYCFLGGYLK